MRLRVQDLREDVKLAGPGAAGILLGEDVRQLGLDPEAFCAVIPGDCGTAGKVNFNRRIYKVEESVPEHERLCAEASHSPNFGERDHPQKGPSWNVLTRFLGGKSEILEDGSAKFAGNFAVINSSIGRDMLANWKAGVPIGVSLRARGVLEEHVIDASSPYAKMNPGAIGQKVDVVSEVEFKGYDWVRVASADTYLPPPELAESYHRLLEAARDPEEEDAVFKTWSEFEKAHPKEAADLRRELLTEAAEHVKAGKPLTGRTDLQNLVEAARSPGEAELAKVKEELREAKAANAGQAESLQELVAWKRDNEKKLAAATLKSDVTEAIDKFIVGRRAGAAIKANVMEELAEGTVADVAGALKRAEKYAKLADAGAGTQGGNAAGGGAGGDGKTQVTEAADGGVSTGGGEKPKGAAAKLTALSGGKS